MFIIIWRNNHREPFPDVNSNGFLETFNSFEEAKELAENTYKIENENSRSPWYHDYAIYELKS